MGSYNTPDTMVEIGSVKVGHGINIDSFTARHSRLEQLTSAKF